MKVTTAEVRHRDYVPFGYIAFEFCRVSFSGFRSKEMERKWRKIEDDLYEKHSSTISENEERIEWLRNRAERLQGKVRNSKPFYRFWYTAEEENSLSRASKLLDEADELERENEKLREEGRCSVYEIRGAVERMLEENGFAKTQVSSTGGECSTEIELWSLKE